MDNPTPNDCDASYTMSKAAEMLRFSRARFYQLIAQGVFPPPVYSLNSRQPLYSSRLLDTCVSIQETGIGFSGQAVRFYRKRKGTPPNLEHKRITTILRGMGLAVSATQVQKALRQFGLSASRNSTTGGEVIRMLFKHFYGDCQEAV